MKNVIAIACLVLVACPPGWCGPKPPFYDDILRQCDVKDQNSLDQCLHLVLSSIRPYLQDGIPEFHIPVLEPLAIQGIHLNQGGGNTKIRASFKELKVAGLSNYTITYVRSNPAQYKFSVGLLFPKLHIEGEYDIHGNLLVIPIKGQGPFWADFEEVKADSYNWLEVQYPLGPAHDGRLHLSHTQTDFEIGKANMRLEKLFNGDELLGQMVNNFLNENASEIIREVKPQFAQEIDRLVARVFSEAIAALPVKVWKRLGKLHTSALGVTKEAEDDGSKQQSSSTRTKENIMESPSQDSGNKKFADDDNAYRFKEKEIQSKNVRKGENQKLNLQ